MARRTGSDRDGWVVGTSASRRLMSSSGRRTASWRDTEVAYQRGRLDTRDGLCRVVLVGLLDCGTPSCFGVGHAPGGVLVGGFQSAQGALEAGHHVTRQQLVAVASLLPGGGPLVDPDQEPAV